MQQKIATFILFANNLEEGRNEYLSSYKKNLFSCGLWLKIEIRKLCEYFRKVALYHCVFPAVISDNKCKDGRVLFV